MLETSHTGGSDQAASKRHPTAPGRLCVFVTAILPVVVATVLWVFGYRLQQSALHAQASPLPPPEPPLPAHPHRTVWWHAPFLSGGGMGAEALQLVLGLERHTEFAGRCVLHAL